MGDTSFFWTPKLTKKLFELRFENDWLFREKKQPWQEFRNILLQNGFPEEMTLDHVRKKWSYTYDSYKIAKKAKNKRWKYYKIFEKHYGKTKILDKYETWNDEWRLKLISFVTESKVLKFDLQNKWKQVEKSLRSCNLPSTCCIQDVKGLWQYLKTTFNRKHRLKLKRNEDTSDWPLYDPMLYYYEQFDQELLHKVETEGCVSTRERKSDGNPYKKEIESEEAEFVWSKDITETFIQIRLQHEWLFREKRWAWSTLLRIMVEEYGFPKTLTNRELSRKWTATFSDYQKALATNNTSWVYYNLFKCYLGDSTFSCNPINGWKPEWVQSLIEARSELEPLFSNKADAMYNHKQGWRAVEMKLRSQGLPIDHSLFDLPELWMDLTKTYRWKRKFADRGMLTSVWPYYEAMTKYTELVKSFEEPTTKENIKRLHCEDYCKVDDDYIMDDIITNDDCDEDDIKLFELKEKMKIRPKPEKIDINMCRACNDEVGSYNIFEACDDQGFDLAYKLKIITGIEIDRSDNFPKQIGFNCLSELERAYSFRRRCQDVDKEFRICNGDNYNKIKIELSIETLNSKTIDERNKPDVNDIDINAFETDCLSDVEVYKQEIKPIIRKGSKKLILRKKKKSKKEYRYRKMCEICGKHTTNLRGHLDAHSIEKTYSCEVCDKKFKFKSGLQLHKAIHDPTPKKTCEVCGKTFHILAQYRRHFVYHANERKYSCETCGKRFNTHDILRVHMRMHTDERPFSCQECGKTFRTAGCVSRHKRIVHKKIAKPNK